jgi:pilus assembly protein Flp/PilA
MFTKLINFFKDEEGATMVEYALMLALIAIVCILAVTFVGQQAELVFNASGSNMSSALGS